VVSKRWVVAISFPYDDRQALAKVKRLIDFKEKEQD